MSKILNVKINDLSFDQVMQKIASFLKQKSLKQIVTINPEFIMAAQKDREFRRILNLADLAVPDGFGLKIASQITGQKIRERITGVDLTWEIAKLASEKGYSIFLLGGKKGVAEDVGKRLRYLYRDLKISKTYAGRPDKKGLIERINNAKPDILLVAFGAPKQDKFIYDNKAQLKVKLAMGVGGTFDYIAGVVPRAPKWMRSLGLEWLYRLIKQPRRLGRIYTAVIKFPFIVLWHSILK